MCASIAGDSHLPREHRAYCCHADAGPIVATWTPGLLLPRGRRPSRCHVDAWPIVRCCCCLGLAGICCCDGIAHFGMNIESRGKRKRWRCAAREKCARWRVAHEANLPKKAWCARPFTRVMPWPLGRGVRDVTVACRTARQHSGGGARRRRAPAKHCVAPEQEWHEEDIRVLWVCHDGGRLDELGHQRHVGAVRA